MRGLHRLRGEHGFIVPADQREYAADKAQVVWMLLE
jgi:hypothetical protein